MSTDLNKRLRHREGVVGVIHPDELYTTEGVFAASGIGEEKLSEARRRKLIKAHEFGKRLYYVGQELIDMILAGDW